MSKKAKTPMGASPVLSPEWFKSRWVLTISGATAIS
jgi:hypothetical protein